MIRLNSKQKKLKNIAFLINADQNISFHSEFPPFDITIIFKDDKYAFFDSRLRFSDWLNIKDYEDNPEVKLWFSLIVEGKAQEVDYVTAHNAYYNRRIGSLKYELKFLLNDIKLLESQLIKI